MAKFSLLLLGLPSTIVLDEKWTSVNIPSNAHGLVSFHETFENAISRNKDTHNTH